MLETLGFLAYQVFAFIRAAGAECGGTAAPPLPLSVGNLAAGVRRGVEVHPPCHRGRLTRENPGAERSGSER